ncbi:LytR C-terminal domain-containing protein [Phytoactinopolyspora halophila]|nr:LytR C-terminal domain-containing protein [Phytoactinopolyspora halophila]
MEPEEPPADYELAPRHTWRHVRTAVTLVVLVVFVVGAAWYSWNNVIPSEDDDVATEASVACVEVVPSEAPAPDAIELNVYNSTDERGLARRVADEMGSRGFVIMNVANDPLERAIEGPAEVRTHPDQHDAAGVVAAVVPGAEVLSDEQADETVDLVLGEAFDGLADQPDPDATIDTCAS